MTTFELRHLQIVDAIARAGSVTRAAGELHLTQPAVSQSLRTLERRLGVELFRRHPKGLEATAAGQRLLKSARLVLEELTSVERELTGSDEDGGGTLRLTTECYTCYFWLPNALAELQCQFPKLDISVVADATRRPIEALLAGEVDLAIVHSAVGYPELERVPLFSDELVVIVAPDHPWVERPFVVAEDFQDQHVLLHCAPEDSDLFQQLLAPAGIVPERVSELHLTGAAIEMVRAGLGVSVLARWAAAPRIANGDIVAVPLTEKGIFREWWAARKRGSGSHRSIDELIARLRRHGSGTHPALS